MTRFVLARTPTGSRPRVRRSRTGPPRSDAVAPVWGGRARSRPLPAVDGLRAALADGLVVVTRDTAPFEPAGVPFIDPCSG